MRGGSNNNFSTMVVCLWCLVLVVVMCWLMVCVHVFVCICVFLKQVFVEFRSNSCIVGIINVTIVN